MGFNSGFKGLKCYNFRSKEITQLGTDSDFVPFILNTDLLVSYRGTIPACGHNHMQHEHLLY